MDSINRPELVKEHNLNLVREQLFRARQATRQQLCALTGISNVTMGTLLGRLVETGEALEVEKLQPTSGRPAKLYRYNSRLRRGLLVSVSLQNGENRLRALWVNLYGESVWEQSQPAGPMDRQATLEYFDRLLRLHGPVSAIAVGLPGVGFGKYLHGDSMGCRLSLEALNDLEREAGVPIRVENDVNLMAMGYTGKRRVGLSETLCYFYLMRGSYGGSAVYLDGKLHLGKGRFAGEFPPHPESPDWHLKADRPREEQDRALFRTVFPYLTVLAPHRVVIASDYLGESHLKTLEEQVAARLEEGWRPKFSLAEDCREDYREGLLRLVLDQLTEF